MNIEDFKPYQYINDFSFERLFRMQGYIHELFANSEPVKVEGEFDINCYHDQQILKDYLQIRFVEELNEATLDIKNPKHFREEITDAFNFLVSAYIMYGYKYTDLRQWKDVEPWRYPVFLETSTAPKKIIVRHRAYIESEIYKLIEQVGKACNLLKNRPWKHSQYLVDLYEFEPAFKEIWIKFNNLCNLLLISKAEIFRLWSLKFQVNLFRIKTAY